MCPMAPDVKVVQISMANTYRPTVCSSTGARLDFSKQYNTRHLPDLYVDT